MKRTFPFQEAILLLILIAVFILVFPTIGKVKFATKSTNGDEGYYLEYSAYIRHNGLPGFKDLFDNYISDKSYWMFPSPLRIGFIAASSIFLGLFGDSFQSIAYLSLLSFILFIAINYYFCSKIFDKQKAVFLSILIAFSPIGLAMSRRALCDGFVTLFLGLSIWLFLDSLYRDSRLIKKFLFSLVFSCAILTKESSVVLGVPLFIYMIIYKIRNRQSYKIEDLFIFVIFPILFLVFVYSFLAGDLSKIIKVASLVANSISTSYHTAYCQSGPWFRYIIDYMLLSPWPVLLSIGYVFILAQDLRKIGLREAYFFIILVITLLMFSFFAKNIRFVLMLDIPMRLFSVFMFYRFTPVGNNRARLAMIIAFILFIVIADLHTFNNFFVKQSIYDPTSINLLKAQRMVP